MTYKQATEAIEVKLAELARAVSDCEDTVERAKGNHVLLSTKIEAYQALCRARSALREARLNFYADVDALCTLTPIQELATALAKSIQSRGVV